MLNIFVRLFYCLGGGWYDGEKSGTSRFLSVKVQICLFFIVYTNIINNK